MIYARIAERYERMHRRWLAYAGAPSQAAFEAALMSHLGPAVSWLDAGAGTGAMARHVLRAGVPVGRVTLLDACAEMLRMARDLPVDRVEGSLLELPFESHRFDLVTVAWAIEASEAPARALREALRVLRPGGRLIVVFCSDAAPGGVMARALRAGVIWRGTGRFLPAQPVISLAEALGAEVLPLRSEGPATVLTIRKPAAPVLRLAA